MPTYDYRCDNCGHEFEEFQSITAKAMRKCPKCRKLKLKRLIGIGAGVIFKGSGFYETDYRSDGYKKAEKAESDSAKPKKEGGEKKDSTSTKSETKSSSDSAKSSGDSKPAKKEKK